MGAMNVAVACGGTGGHTFPGVATAQALVRRGHAVTLWLGGRDVESLSAGSWVGPVRRVRASGLGAGPIAIPRAGLSFVRAVRASLRYLRADRPDVMLAMGSYASVGPVLAARWLRIPVVLHEANAVPGKALRLLSRHAAAVGVGFPSAAAAFRRTRVEVTGFPLRPEFAAGLDDARDRARFTFLVMGGSQGARVLNETVPEALGLLRETAPRPFRVIHLAGRADADRVRERYAARGIDAEVHPFLAEVWRAYGAADYAIARAGAATCAELAAAGLPALLVPYPHAAADHQTANAMALAAVGGVDVRAQSDLSSDGLAAHLADRMRDAGRLTAMRRALTAIAAPDADVRLARLVELVGGTDHADL